MKPALSVMRQRRIGRDAADPLLLRAPRSWRSRFPSYAGAQGTAQNEGAASIAAGQPKRTAIVMKCVFLRLHVCLYLLHVEWFCFGVYTHTNAPFDS